MAGSVTKREPEFGVDINHKPIPVLGQRFGQGVDTSTDGSGGGGTAAARHKLGDIATVSGARFPANGTLTEMMSYRFDIALLSDLAAGVPPNIFYRFGVVTDAVPTATIVQNEGWMHVSTNALREFVRKIPRGCTHILIYNPGAASIRVYAERLD